MEKMPASNHHVDSGTKSTINDKSQDVKTETRFDVENIPKRPDTSFHHFRYVIIVLAGAMMGTMLLLRINITVAMLSMVNATALYLIEHPNSTVEEYFEPDYVERGEFVWNNEIQQIIISGYMLAYTLPQTFTTKLSMEYGLRPSISLSIALCSISTLVTPVVSYWGWYWVLAMRLINALGASAILPCMVNVIEEFMPLEDAPIGVALFQFTTNSIMVTTPLVVGFLTSVHWKWAYYIPGTIGSILSLIWYLLAADSPQASRFVGQKELDLISGITHGPDAVTSKRSKKRTDLPWYFMLKIKSFYALTAICSLYVGAANAFFFILPKYFDKILNVSVQDVGILNFTVQIGVLFSMVWSTPLSSFLMRQFHLSITTSRRIVVTICSSIVAATYIYLGAYHDHLVPVISINRFFHMTHDTLTLATIMSQFGQAGVSGLVYSMMNTLGNPSTVIFCWAAAIMVLHLIIYDTCCHSSPVPIPPEKHTESSVTNSKA